MCRCCGRQPQLSHQLGKAWVGTDGVESEVGLQTRQLVIVFLKRNIGPLKNLSLSPNSAGTTGLEPAASAVTGVLFTLTH